MLRWDVLQFLSSAPIVSPLKLIGDYFFGLSPQTVFLKEKVLKCEHTKNKTIYTYKTITFCSLVLGEKPFMCEACGKSFASKEYLRHHSNIHTGSRPYKCETCGRGFAQRNSLHQHLKIHTGEM